jgi:hypothetical protein
VKYTFLGPEAFNSMPPELIEFSGKFPNDLGLYNSCLDSGFNYANMMVTRNIINSIF